MSALDKYQNWSASTLFCHISWAQLITQLFHTQQNKGFCVLSIISKTFYQVEKVIKYSQQNTITHVANESTLHNVHVFVSAVRNVRSVNVKKCNAHALLSHSVSIVNSDWLKYVHSVRGVYNCINQHIHIQLACRPLIKWKLDELMMLFKKHDRWCLAISIKHFNSVKQTNKNTYKKQTNIQTNKNKNFLSFKSAKFLYN